MALIFLESKFNSVPVEIFIWLLCMSGRTGVQFKSRAEDFPQK